MNCKWVKNKKEQVTGRLSVHDDELYMFDDDDCLVVSLIRIKLLWINPHGIMISGFRKDKSSRTIKVKYIYVELYFAF